ncbi:MAG: 4Fe-4S binding protein [Clostridiales bacterium]|nr:4Fe-4S binding protein [Clostridiales bacterium]
MLPVTLYYFSPTLIIDAGLNGIINGSFIVFLLMFFLSIPFGRIFFSYACPAGGLQECALTVNDRSPRQGLLSGWWKVAWQRDGREKITDAAS